MAQFSGTVKITGLNDFIAPAQGCVVSLNGGRLDAKQIVEEEGRVQIQRAPGGKGFSQASSAQENTPVKVTLHDCLACSGCITSAETVLLEHQSIDEFLTKVADPNVLVVVSISPQSRAALATLYGLTPAAALFKLTTFLRLLGVRYVFDTTASRDFALLETAAEFVSRYRMSRQCSTSGREEPGHAIGSGMEVDGAGPAAPASRLPMLASACPGWVCYAEKTHGDHVLPHISSAKSPMAVMGALVKRWFASQAGLSPQQLYHCSVMPCYDKKLEASRDDFNTPGTSIPEVDSCLTTVEVQQLLEQRGVLLPTLPDSPPDALLSSLAEDGRLFGWPGGSGGYMEMVMRTAAKELFGQDLPAGRLRTRPGRNPDLQEAVLEDDAGQPLLRFASAYGFRNIQTLMRKIKSGRCEYDYVEIMACPGGCLNGGGQLKPPPGMTAQQLLQHVEETYHHADVVERHPVDNPLVQQVYTQWLQGSPYSDQARELLHTAYHRREKTVIASDW